MHRSLSDYISLLEREGELVRIAAPVSPMEEIAEITDRVSKTPGGGKALLFENTGTEFPVLTNRVRCRGGANASRSYGRVLRRRSRRFRS